jgi:hypothetical protein
MRQPVAEAERDGTYFVAQPFHCAVGTKPAREGREAVAAGIQSDALHSRAGARTQTHPC